MIYVNLFSQFSLPQFWWLLIHLLQLLHDPIRATIHMSSVHICYSSHAATQSRIFVSSPASFALSKTTSSTRCSSSLRSPTPVQEGKTLHRSLTPPAAVLAGVLLKCLTLRVPTPLLPLPLTTPAFLLRPSNCRNITLQFYYRRHRLKRRMLFSIVIVENHICYLHCKYFQGYFLI